MRGLRSQSEFEMISGPKSAGVQRNSCRVKADRRSPLRRHGEVLFPEAAYGEMCPFKLGYSSRQGCQVTVR
jgi:hypothetical protein